MIRINSFYNNLIFHIVTCFGIGKIKYAPGTFGSVLAFPIVICITHFFNWQDNIIISPNLLLPEAELLTLMLYLMYGFLFIFVVGWWFSALYIGNNKDLDPKEVVIDEVAGQLLTIILILLSRSFITNSAFEGVLSRNIIDLLFLVILPFLLFRFYDIKKPWPINWLDSNVKGGLGIMLDDVLAAIFAAVTQYLIVFVIIDFYGAK